MDGKEYLKSLGFQTFDIDLTSGEIDTDLGEDAETVIYIHFERKTVINWMPGYDDIGVLLGAGLTEAEEKELYKLGGS